MSLDIKTVSQIKEQILANISNEYEKSNGELTHDIPAATSIVLGSVYDDLLDVSKKTDVDYLISDELTRFVRQRKGIKRKPATNAIGKVLVKGEGIVSKGDLFETTSGTQFEAIGTTTVITEILIDVKAVKAGASGNVGAGTIILMPVTLQGIGSVNNPYATYDGFAEESDAALRERYYEAIQRPATSGNIYHYMNWAKEVPGVGDARVLSLWNGDNTVKVVLIDADKKPASTELVSEVQLYIDPLGSTWGAGAGQAPIGAYCTVVSATALNINILADVVEESGEILITVIQRIKDNITAYLKEIAFKQSYVSYAIIGSIIISTQGVADYNNLKVNLGTVNISVSNQQVAILGTVNIT